MIVNHRRAWPTIRCGWLPVLALLMKVLICEDDTPTSQFQPRAAVPVLLTMTTAKRMPEAVAYGSMSMSRPLLAESCEDTCADVRP